MSGRKKRRGERGADWEKKVLEHLKVWACENERENERRGEERVGNVANVRDISVFDVDV